MAINKVVYGNNTLVDLTNDSVSANNLLEGETAHDKSGNPVTGTAKQGHIVQNSSGTDMTQRSKMQFADSFVSDDETNGKTIVENIKEVDPADYDSTTDEGIIVTDNGNDVPIGEIEEDVVSVTADGVKTWATLLNELWSKIDSSKVTDNALFVYDTGTNRVIYNLYIKTNNTYAFYLTRTNNSNISNGTVDIRQSNSRMFEGTISTSETTISNISSTVPTNGTVISLHYGTSSGIVELNTDARHCMMSDGVTSVEQALTWKYVARVVNHDAISIPTGAREIFCLGEFGNMSVMFPTSVGNARSGYYSSANDNGDIYVAYSNNQLVVSKYMINGSDVISQGVRVYYR